MTGLETTLLIILAAGFAILLLLSIVVVIIILRILQSIHNVTRKAEAATEDLSEVMKSLAKKVGPGVASGLISLALKRFKKRRDSDEEES